MKKDPGTTPKPLAMKSGNDKIGIFFIDHLNRVYCAKAHLIERLQEIIDHVGFADLKTAILKTIGQLEKQLAEMDKIYSLLNLNYSFENCSSLISGLDGSFISIQQHSENRELRDLFIISYMYFAESMEMISFKMLHMVSNEIENKEISALLAKSDEASKADRELLISATKKFLKA